MKFTIDIDINNSKALALLNYIKTLDFINIEDDSTDWWEQLTASEKKLIQKGAKEIKQGKGINHDDVRSEIDQMLGKTND